MSNENTDDIDILDINNKIHLNFETEKGKID
jgi:hypothetical protein